MNVISYRKKKIETLAGYNWIEALQQDNVNRPQTLTREETSVTGEDFSDGLLIYQGLLGIRIQTGDKIHLFFGLLVCGQRLLLSTQVENINVCFYIQYNFLNTDASVGCYTLSPICPYRSQVESYSLDVIVMGVLQTALDLHLG